MKRTSNSETTRLVTSAQHLKGNDDAFRLLFDLSNDAIMVHEMKPDGTAGPFIEVNELACQRLGYAKEELLKLSPHDIDDPETPDTPEVLTKIREEGHTVFERNHIAKNGRRIPVEISSRIYGKDNRKYIISIVRDITERKIREQQLRQSQEQYKTLFNTMKEGLIFCQIICDQTGVPIDFRYLGANPSFARMTGLKASEIVGKTSKELLPQHDPGRFERYGKVALSGESAHFEEFNARLGRWFDMSAFQTDPGKFAVTFIDITESKLSSENLERSVRERNTQLYEACDQLVEEISQRRENEEALRVTQRFLEIANRDSAMVALLNEFVCEIKTLTKCQAVGIRLLDPKGNIPYQAYKGFSDKFYELENPLSTKSDNCMCINVITGRTNSELSFYTAGGSFFMNHTTKFLAGVSEEEKGVTRNVCNAFGYESVAVIPIRANAGIIGLVHIADEKEDMVPTKLVNLLENVVGHVGSAVERIWLTEALHASERQFRMIFNSASDAIILWEYSRPENQVRVIEANQVACDRYGYSHQEMVNLSAIDLNTPASYNSSIPLFKTLAEKGFATYEVVHKTKSGRLIPSEVSGHFFEQAGRKYVLSVVRDITLRKETEKRLSEAFDREKVLHRQLKKEMSKRTEFTRALIHELKTPLTPILASSDMLLRIAPDGPTKRLANQIYTGAVDLDARTNELFDLIRGELGILELRCQTTDLGELLNGVIDYFKQAAEAKSIKIGLEINSLPPPVVADKKKIRQALVNLVDNAIKYTPESGTVTASISKKDRHAVIEIRDTGPGIPVAEQSRIFEPYSRLDRDRENLRGLGLGLAISKVFVGLHGAL